MTILMSNKRRRPWLRRLRRSGTASVWVTTQIFTIVRMLSNSGSQDLRFCGRPWLHICGTVSQARQSSGHLVWLDWLMLKTGSAWARTCVRPASPCFAMVMLKNGSRNGSRPPPNVLCFVSSLVGVQVRQSGCIRNIFVPRKHHRKSRKYHGNTTENHGKSRKITEGFFQANHGNSRIPGKRQKAYNDAQKAYATLLLSMPIAMLCEFVTVVWEMAVRDHEVSRLPHEVHVIQSTVCANKTKGANGW